MNIQVIAGHIGQDAEVKAVGTGSTVTTFSVAVSEYAGKDKEKRTTWFRVELWDREGIAPYLTKGSKVTVSGRARCNEYEKDGVKRQFWSIDATRGEVVFGGGGGSGRDEEDESSKQRSTVKAKGGKRTETDYGPPF